MTTWDQLNEEQREAVDHMLAGLALRQKAHDEWGASDNENDLWAAYWALDQALRPLYRMFRDSGALEVYARAAEEAAE